MRWLIRYTASVRIEEFPRVALSAEDAQRPSARERAPLTLTFKPRGRLSGAHSEQPTRTQDH